MGWNRGTGGHKVRTMARLRRNAYPTDDTRLLTKAAQEAVERVYREGFRYSKAEVLLLDLSQ